jgi:hypothetical protein
MTDEEPQGFEASRSRRSLDSERAMVTERPGVLGRKLPTAKNSQQKEGRRGPGMGPWEASRRAPGRGLGGSLGGAWEGPGGAPGARKKPGHNPPRGGSKNPVFWHFLGGVFGTFWEVLEASGAPPRSRSWLLRFLDYGLFGEFWGGFLALFGPNKQEGNRVQKKGFSEGRKPPLRDLPPEPWAGLFRLLGLSSGL